MKFHSVGSVIGKKWEKSTPSSGPKMPSSTSAMAMGAPCVGSITTMAGFLSTCSSPTTKTQQIYIPLPKQALKFTHPCPDAFSPDPYRHVCITDACIVMLVFTEYSQPTFTIITWSLNGRYRPCSSACFMLLSKVTFYHGSTRGKRRWRMTMRTTTFTGPLSQHEGKVAVVIWK